MTINCPGNCRQFRRCLIIVLTLIPLAGCISIPPVLNYASWALSGVSYVTTGKGPSDHAISSVMHRDCSLLRALMFKPVCIPVNEDTNKPLWAVLFNKDLEKVPMPPELLTEHEGRIAAR